MIPGPKSYVDLLDEVVQKRAGEQRFGSPIRPSNAGSCTRRMAYDYLGHLGVTEPIQEIRKPSVNRLLGLGHYIEEQVVKDLKDIPGLSVRFAQQVVDIFDLPGGTKVEGSLDAFMWNDEVRGVLDVKTIGDRWSSHYASKWDGLMKDYARYAETFGTNSFYVTDLGDFLKKIGPSDSLYKNLIQLNLYACSDFLQKRGVTHGSIVRYNKNNSSLMEIRFTPSMEVFESTRNRMAVVEAAGAARDAALAPKERVLGDMDCAYCPYKDICWVNTPKKEFYKAMPKKQWADRLNNSEIESLFEHRANAELAATDLADIDRELILLLDNAGVNKLKLENGDVFEVKVLKTGADLRRSKE